MCELLAHVSEMRNMLSAMQCGELTVSRGLELLEIWFAGNYNDDMLPRVDNSLGEDETPISVLTVTREKLVKAQSRLSQVRNALECITGRTLLVEDDFEAFLKHEQQVIDRTRKECAAMGEVKLHQLIKDSS